jgi:hypothetical protein
MEQTEHGGGEGSAIERRDDPTVADGHGRCCPNALRISVGDCASELGLPSPEGR